MKPVSIITGAGGLLGGILCEELLDTHHIIGIYRNKVPACNSQLVRRIDPTIPARGASSGETFAGSKRDEGTTGEKAAGIYCIQADLTSREDIRRVVEVTLGKYGRIDHVINSAADIKFHGNLRELWQNDEYPVSQMTVNCIAPILLASAAHEYCWKNSKEDNLRWNRSVLNVSSQSGLRAHSPKGQGYYAASKAALNILTQHLALELAPYSVRVNAVCPGTFKDRLSGNKYIRSIIGLLNSAQSGEVMTSFKE